MTLYDHASFCMPPHAPLISLYVSVCFSVPLYAPECFCGAVHKGTSRGMGSEKV